MTFKDVGGLTETKRTLASIVQLLRGGGALVGHTRFNPPKGILLTGPRAPARRCWHARWRESWDSP